MNLFEFQLLKHSATGQSFLGDSLDLQTALHDLARRFLVLIKGVGVDIQRGRWLAVSEKPRNCADVRAAGDEQACRRVARLWTFKSVARSFRAPWLRSAGQ